MRKSSSQKGPFFTNALLPDIVAQALNILLKATSDTKSTRRQADQALRKMIMSNRRKGRIITAGTLSSKDQTTDVYIPLKNGGTLSLGYKSRSTQPKPLAFRSGTMPRIIIGADPTPTPTPTMEYFNTPTSNSGFSDQQGDSKADTAKAQML